MYLRLNYLLSALRDLKSEYLDDYEVDATELIKSIDNRTNEQLVSGDHFELMQAAILIPGFVVNNSKKFKGLTTVINTAWLVLYIEDPLGTIVTANITQMRKMKREARDILAGVGFDGFFADVVIEELRKAIKIKQAMK